MRPLALAVVAVWASLAVVHGQARAAAAGPNPDPERFAAAIAAFEAADLKTPPPAGAVLFVGSSSITSWDVASTFPALTTIRRGYGGSHVSDTIHFFARIVAPYRPALVVFYAGDADVAGGKPAATIARDTGTLVALVHEQLPATPVVVIGTKPSPAHWAHMETIRSANRLVQTHLAADPLAAYVDVEAALLGADGQPRPEFYTDNRLNLSARGYEAWTAAVRPTIERLTRTP